MRLKLILVFLLFVTSMSMYGEDPVYVMFRQYCSEAPSSAKQVKLPEKGKRASSTAADFAIDYDDELPDSIQYAIEMALKIWSTRTQSKFPILLEIGFNDLGEDIVFTTETYYYEKNGLLYSSINDKLNGGAGCASPDIYDGIITFNSSLDYNCSFNAETKDDGYNMLTQTLRAVARCLGFGSNLKYNKDELNYSINPSVYDSHLFKGDESLIDLLTSSDRLEFATSNAVKFISSINNNEYEIYSPSEYVHGINLNFVKNENSLMSYKIGNGSKYFDIDDVTLDILNSLGFNFILNSILSIGCDELGSSGIGSAFKSYTFSTHYSGLKKIDLPHWTYSLMGKSGNLIEIMNSNTVNFTIPPVDNIDRFKRDINGNLEGYISFDCLINNKVVKAKQYKISLELQPVILSVLDLNRVFNTTDNYTANFKVNYRGAETLKVHLWEDGDIVVGEQIIKEPVLAHVQTGLISNIFNNHIKLFASNQYGTATHVIDLLAGSAVQNYEIEKKENKQVENELLYDVYTLEGTPVFTDAKSRIISDLRKGVYVVITKDGTSNNRKIVYVQ